jgi:hypothetical protein
MVISVTELVAVLVMYTAMTGSGMYWLWRRAQPLGLGTPMRYGTPIGAPRGWSSPASQS